MCLWSEGQALLDDDQKKWKEKGNIYTYGKRVDFANIYMFIWASTFYKQTWRFPVYKSIFMIEQKEQEEFSWYYGTWFYIQT